MNAIETTAIFEGQEHLRLAHPVPEATSGHRVRVIVLFEKIPGGPSKQRGDFRSAIGSYYRDYPQEPMKDSREWLAELREGETEMQRVYRFTPYSSG